MKKIISKIIILFSIIIVIIGILFFICFMKYINIKPININISDIIGALLIVFTYLMVFCIVPGIISNNAIKLVNELFILDIYNRNNDSEHIRITKSNLLFKYKLKIRSMFYFPKSFSYFFGERWTSPEFFIKNKTILTTNELTNIVEKIKRLKDLPENEIIVNIKGIKKNVKANEINEIFAKYKIQI